jgi:hypothetical protein
MAEPDDAPHHHGFFRHEAPLPDGPSPLGWRGYGTCVFCQSSDTVWQHDLNRSLAAFRTLHGSGSTCSTSLPLCERCEALYNDGDYGALAQLRQAQPWYQDDTLAGLLVGIAAVCRADRGPRPLAVPEFPAGFEPWDQLTGAEWMFDLWPEQHRRTVAETRRPQLDDDSGAQIQLLASPWPSLTLRDALNMLFRWAELDWDPEVTADPYPSRVAEALTWTDQQAKTFLDEHTDEPPRE